MKCISLTWLVLALGLVSAPAGAAVFTFEWSGFVAEITDGNGDPATMPDINVGDSFVATTTYNDALFGDGENVTGDGLDYKAPPGQTMRYEFESGVIFLKGVAGVRARDAVGFDQWSWDGDDGFLMFQANDDTDASFELPLPELFAEINALFLSRISFFLPSENNYLELLAEEKEDDRTITFYDVTFSITAASVPEPATLALFGLGLAGLGAVRRKRLAA